MVLLLEKAWMEIVRMLDSLLVASSLFVIFVVSWRRIILVPVMGH